MVLVLLILQCLLSRTKNQSQISNKDQIKNGFNKKIVCPKRFYIPEANVLKSESKDFAPLCIGREQTETHWKERKEKERGDVLSVL